MTQLVGTCDRCKQRKPLFLVPRGNLQEPYLCEYCVKYTVEAPAPDASEGGKGPAPPEEQTIDRDTLLLGT